LYDQTIDAQKNELLSKNLASLKSKARAFFEEIIMQIEPPNEFM
jgi:restriction endonuclease Mrr